MRSKSGNGIPLHFLWQRRRVGVILAGILAAAALTLAMFGASERSAAAQSEPETVGAVTDLGATAAGQPDGTVHLTWNAAENAQVYFVYYIEQAEGDAGNWAAGKMRAFNDTEATIDGLAGGTTYYFAASGMRWHFGRFEPLWGGWDYWETAAPAGSAASPPPTAAQSEPETVGAVTDLDATAAGQPDGTVHLTWNAAENAQVYFVYYIEQAEGDAGNWAAGKMRAFNDTEATIDGLAGGTTYYFAASGMRWHFGTFKPLWGDWDYWETAAPAEPTVHLSDLEHTDRLELAQANQLKALPWIADGIDDSERDSAEKLVEAAIWWPYTFDALLQKSWLQDAITRDEAAVIEHIYWLTRSYSDDATQLRVSEAVVALLDMPFLDAIESPDAMAAHTLRRLASRDTTVFSNIMAHPKISDGITDEEAKIVTLMDRTYRHKPEVVPVLLDGLDGTGDVYLQERTIDLPHSGEILLTIIRLRDHETDSMNLLEHAVRANEEFMGEPYYTNWVALFFVEGISPGHGEAHFGTHMAFREEYDVDPYLPFVPFLFAHEVAHYYWRGSSSQRWLKEGAANFLGYISENDRIGSAVAATYFDKTPTPCIDVTTLAQQEVLDSVPGTDQFICNYYLGERFFIDLYDALGEDTFRQGFSSLYLKRLQDDPTDDCEGIGLGICHVEAAFKTGASGDVADKVDEVIDRWYYGIGAEESVSLNDLERADRLEPAQANQLKALPWVADGIDHTERDAAQMLIDAARNYPDTFTALMQKPWATDADLTPAETNVIYGIRWTARRDEASTLAILDMPFLETLEFDDSLAVLALYRLARYADDGRFKTLMEHPTLEGGITDDLTTLVAATGTIREADEVARMLNPGYADIEIHTGQTTLSPEIKISVVRHPDVTAWSGTGPELVRIAEQLEGLMQVPLPKPHLIFVISDWATSASSRGISQGKRYDFAYGLRGDRENPQRFATQYATDRPLLPSVIIHEIGHDYYGNEIKSWLNHTPIKAGFEYIYRLDGRGPSETPDQVLNIIQRRDCTARNIQHLEEMNPPSSDRGNSLCHHYLAYLMGRELLEAVGQDEFMARMRRLYHLKNQMVAEGYDPGIAEIRGLFPDQLEIVERYWSGDVGNPEEKYWGGLASVAGHPVDSYFYFGCCCPGCMPVDA